MPWDAIKFRQLIQKSGRSQSELARELDLPQSTVQRLADPVIPANPTIRIVEMWAQRFECEVQDLLSKKSPEIKATGLSGQPGSLLEIKTDGGPVLFKSRRPLTGHVKRGAKRIRSVAAASKKS